MLKAIGDGLVLIAILAMIYVFLYIFGPVVQP